MTDRLYAELATLIESSLSSEAVLDRLLDLKRQVEHLNAKIAQMDRANSELSTEMFALSGGGEAKEKCLAALSSAQLDRDPERAHSDAEEALCELLKALGYSDVVEEYLKVEAWFA